MPKLSDARIRSAKPKSAPYKVFDTDGLFLSVQPSGAKWWRQRYRFAGKERLLSLGVYPLIGLADARERGTAIRKQAALGIDPGEARKAQKAAVDAAQTNTFKAVVLAWHAKFTPQWSPDHANTILSRLNDNALPWIGNKPIRDVKSDDIVRLMDRMAERGAIDTARRVLQYLKKIFKWSIARGFIEHSPVAHIDPRDHLPRVGVKHRAAIKDPIQFGLLLRSIDAYQGGFEVRCGLQLLALTFVRPGELRHAEWREFRLDGKEPLWRIPAARMKMGGEDHLVPLSRQAVEVLRSIQPLTGHDGVGFVFPGHRSAARPLSENAFIAAIRTMGFTQAQHSPHGFRGSASTMLNEMQWNRDAIELQLSHMERDATRESYNSATHLPLRRQMMQAWADHLDELKVRCGAANYEVSP
jgi:integrase